MPTPPARPLLLVALALAGGCGAGGSAENDANRAKLASELIQCKNDKSNMKDQLDQAKNEIDRLKASSDTTKHLDPIELKANPAAAEVVHREGNLPPDLVLKVLKTNSGGLRACYERGLKRNPNLQYVNSVTVHFAVKNTGNATGVSFSPRSDGEMEKCMGAAIGKWHFPTFSGDPVQFEAPVSLVAK